jgi:hypothetical protein
MALSPLGILSAAAARGFSPANLNPILWLDAADASTITQSSGSVSQWNNKGSLGNFTQASGALQPTTNASTLNGKNVIDFNADYLSGVNQNEWKPLHDGTKHFISMVLKPGAVANPNVFYGILSNQSGNSNQIGMSFFWDDRASVPRNERFDQIVANGNADQYQSEALSPDNALPANTFSIYHSLTDPTNATLLNRIQSYRNNLAKIVTTAPAANVALSPSSSNPVNPLYIGVLASNSGTFVGSIAELIIVSGANATDENRELVRDYLNEKWAVY